MTDAQDEIGDSVKPHFMEKILIFFNIDFRSLAKVFVLVYL